MTETNEAKIRLLLCGTCGSMEELPDYEGPVEGDQLLDYLVSRHRYADGNEHQNGLLVRDILERHWRDPGIKKQIVEQINARTGEGLGAQFYDTKNTFMEDAMTCWKKHNKTSDCDEYKSPRKALVPDTRAERKEAGLGKVAATTYLCDFCPMKSIVQQKYYKKNGFYN